MKNTRGSIVESLNAMFLEYRAQIIAREADFTPGIELRNKKTHKLLMTISASQAKMLPTFVDILCEAGSELSPLGAYETF